MYYSTIEKWIAGYKVYGAEWIDGKNYYLNIAYYRPGQSLTQKPVTEKSVLIPLEEWESKKAFLDSIVRGIMER